MPLLAPATGAVLLHCSGIVAAIVLYGIIGGFFQHNLWGGAGPGGAIQVNLVSGVPFPCLPDRPPKSKERARDRNARARRPLRRNRKRSKRS